MSEEVNLRDIGEDEHMNPSADKPPGRTWRRAANSAVANNFIFNKEDKNFYYEKYSCIPNCKDQVGGPPIFVLLVTVIQIGFFIYYATAYHETRWWTISHAAVESSFIFSPYAREQVWRFLTYMFLHAGIMHILSNSLVQLIIGIPLELVHGSLRVGGIYLIGVIAGSLGSSVFDVGTYLVGASGGGFALMFAFLANIIMNWDSMKKVFAAARLAIILVFILSDFGAALYRRYGADADSDSVSYAAHVAGAIAGLTMGLVILKNFRKQVWEDILFKISIAVFSILIIVAIFFNIFCPCYESYK